MKIESTKESVMLFARDAWISDYYLINLDTGQQGTLQPERVKQIWKENQKGKIFETPLPDIGEEIILKFDGVGGSQQMSFLLRKQKKNRGYSNGVGAPRNNGSFNPNNIRLALDVLF